MPVGGVGQKVIQSSQLAFMKGTNILEGLVILHETIHEMHWKKVRRDNLKAKL